MTSHPDVEALAFFAEELLEPGEERTVASHIETCATCATTLEELTGVTEALAAAPVPAMPRDLADLLDRRVAEAARERAEGGGGSDSAPVPAATHATVTPLPRRRRGFGGVNLPRLMMVAAAAAVVAGGGAALFNGPAVQESAEPGGVAAPLQQDEEEAAPDTAQAYTPQVVRSGTVYTGTDLAEQASRTLGLSPVGNTPEDGGTEPLAVEETSPPGVDECAALLGEELGTRFTLVDEAHYGDGTTRAWAMFALDGDEYDVYVVDPLCAQGGDASEGVLAQESVPKP
ncbi:anti-sigma factor family protein [Nocardiopsis sp. NPDC058631]|uniref:anti-sigma factor family protein n=1 Tax=Nocardiopsis sp. NPDC058631 TaxID=3346566 RepID=UPI003666B81E